LKGKIVREVIDGVPFFYKGYKSVLNKTQKLEDIKGDSGLQSLLKNAIGDLIKAQIDKKRYRVLAGETGSHSNHRNNFGLDVVIYDRNVLNPSRITTKYIDVKPKIVIEIDVKVEIPNGNGNLFETYILPKIQQLFAFGVEKVIWYFTKSKTIIYATSANQCSFLPWESDVEVMPNVIVNIVQLLEEEEINLDLNL
jgi:Uma2 family endonuclease